MSQEVIEITEREIEVIEVVERGPAGPAGIQGPTGPEGSPASVSIYSSAAPDATLNTLVGGATPEPASTWKTRTIVQALDTILFPTVLPFISTPKSVALSITGSTGTLEVGSLHNRTLSFAFNRGRITNGDNSLGPELVGASSSVSYSGTGIVGSTSNGNLTSVAVVFGTNQWTATVSHDIGTGAYFDNKQNASNVLDASRAAGTAVGNSIIITGVYPWYHLRSPVSFTSAQFATAIASFDASGIHPSATIAKVVGSASNTISVPYNVNNEFLGVAYDFDLTTKTIYYVSGFDNGPITAVFNGVVTENNIATASWTRNYKMHISTNPLTNSNSIIELRNA